MGRERKKGQSGAAVAYISRNQALKKLQLTLPDFRRLCILKGIFPVEPKHKKKVGGAGKTYYLTKDIQFLAHEPVLAKMRNFKVFVKRLRRAMGRDDLEQAERLSSNEPVMPLDHIVRERYPTFVDALRDMDDCLSMVFLFATLPQENRVKRKVVQKCRRLSVEFMHYVMASNRLRKVFISIKGIYYQVEIQGETITWVVPHQFAQHTPSDIDFRIMLTFLELYTTLLGFINYHLFTSLNLHYPPMLSEFPPTEDGEGAENDEVFESLAHQLATLPKTALETEEAEQDEELAQLVDADLNADEQAQRDATRKQEEEVEKARGLFSHCRFFLGREVPREPLVFIIRCFGGTVSWSSTQAAGATYQEDDDTVTHHIVDRPKQMHRYLSRYYLQPQWVFDCINAKRLLPVDQYLAGANLPPHLSPFVEAAEGEYIPPEQVERMEEEGEEIPVMELEPARKSKKRKAMEEEEETMKEELHSGAGEALIRPGVVEKPEDPNKLAKKQAEEEKRLAIMAMPKKKKRLYGKIMQSRQKKSTEVRKLKQRREVLEQQKGKKAKAK
ncbi:pescadillo homolog [Sycon ciliatum]|uniref:pescadillo homolog n=1 Tax=Sycon ciliatum TaxID=27933 RepID=UPI0020A9FC45|eukprot:scpid43701/ scgid28801/ Pescadillo homolog